MRFEFIDFEFLFVLLIDGFMCGGSSDIDFLLPGVLRKGFAPIMFLGSTFFLIGKFLPRLGAFTIAYLRASVGRPKIFSRIGPPGSFSGIGKGLPYAPP